MTSNARVIADLQAVAIGIQLVGLDRLPEVMRPVVDVAEKPTVGISALCGNEINPSPTTVNNKGET